MVFSSEGEDHRARLEEWAGGVGVDGKTRGAFALTWLRCVWCFTHNPHTSGGKRERAVVDKRHVWGCRLPTTHPLTVTFLLRC